MSQTELTPQVLYLAYSQGYFPMPEPDTGEILWYRPDPRAVFPLDTFHVSRSLRRVIKKAEYKVTVDRSFTDVIAGCGERQETWINPQITKAYQRLHSIGAAHSVEIWNKKQLVGGVYGVSFGGAFFAESMFFRQPNASKLALFHLVEKLKERSFVLLECQFLTSHLKSLGAVEISDKAYMKTLTHALELDTYFS